jgi:hypothetical protein
MFIAIVLVIFIDGQTAQDFAAFPSQQECVKANADMDKALAVNKKVAGWTNSCVNVSDLKKPGVKA